MQANPALPWAAGTGGTINFTEPVTAEELVAGKIKLTLQRSDGVVVNPDNVRFVNSEGTLTVMDGGSTVYGCSLRSDGLSMSMNEISSSSVYSLTDVRIATEVHDFEIYADQECTVRPEVGESYDKLFVKFNKAIGENDSVTYGNDNEPFKSLVINTPTTEVYEDPYEISLYIDFAYSEIDPIAKGSIIEVSAVEAMTVRTPLETSFGEIIYE